MEPLRGSRVGPDIGLRPLAMLSKDSIRSFTWEQDNERITSTDNRCRAGSGFSPRTHKRYQAAISKTIAIEGVSATELVRFWPVARIWHRSGKRLRGADYGTRLRPRPPSWISVCSEIFRASSTWILRYWAVSPVWYCQARVGRP